MSLSRKAGTTDVSVVVRIIDSTDGTPETGVTSATAGLDLQYRREGAASVAITESDLAALTTAHTDGGMLHIGNGYYRLDLPDAACAAGATGVLIHGTATGMVVVGEYIQLVAYDPFDTVRLGLTALPNAAADAPGGLPISDAGGLDLDARIGTDIPAILVDTGTTLQAELDGIQADTEDIQTRLPAALVSGRMDSNVGAISDDATAADNAEKYFDGTGYGNVVVRGAITIASQTLFQIANDSTDDNAYLGCTVVIEDQTNPEQKHVSTCVAHTTGTLQIADTPVFTIANGDIATVLANIAVRPTTKGRRMTVESDGMAHADVKEIEGVDATNQIRDAILDDATRFSGADIAAILLDTAEIGAAGAGLTAIPKTGYALSSTGLDGVVLDAAVLAQINGQVDAAWTTQIADSVNTDGTLPTREQATYLMLQMLTEFAISGTTLTVKKLDGTTTLATFTLDDATNPTSLTRAT